MHIEHWNTYININLALDLNKRNKGNLEYLKGKIEDILSNPLAPVETDLFLTLDTKAQALIELNLLDNDSH